MIFLYSISVLHDSLAVLVRHSQVQLVEYCTDDSLTTWLYLHKNNGGLIFFAISDHINAFTDGERH